MAGAGYKLFSTGDVLSASDVNTYLQQQTVMVFASAAARTTALASVLAEGMVTYLKDTDVVEIYTGAAWVSLDDPNAIQNSIVDAKGDIITATADNTPARLAVGTNGQYLQADSTAATGLKWATVASGTFPKLTFVSPTANFTTSSTSYVDATGYTITFTPASATNTIEVKFNAGYALSGNTKSFRFMLDGVDKGGIDLLIGEINPTMILHITNLSAASHTIKLQMLSVGGGSATLAGSASGYLADFSVLEIY